LLANLIHLPITTAIKINEVSIPVAMRSGIMIVVSVLVPAL
jgi:hypothetical protein